MTGRTTSVEGPHPPVPAGRTAVATSLTGIARERAWALGVGSATVVWTIALLWIVRDRHADFRYARFDLGNMVQAVWNTAHGRPLENTNVAGEQVSRLGSHVDPILALLAPLWMIAPSPLLLASVQVLAIAAGAIPVFWLARRHSGSEKAAALVVLVYLAYPWIAWAAVDAFHPVALAVPLLLFCIWFLDTDRVGAFAACAVLTAATGELMGLLVAALGVWYALGRGQRRAGSVIAAAGAAWVVFSVYVVVPAFSGGPSVYYAAFGHVGGSPTDVLRTTVTDPLAILSAMTGSEDLLYLFLLSAPLAGGFLLAPGLAACALPQLAFNLLAVPGGNTDPHEHYISGILPFAIGALAVGLGRLSPPRRARGAGLALALSIAATAALGPWPGTLLGSSRWDPLTITDEHVRVLERAVELVPDDAPVSATNRVGSHLSARRFFYSVPVIRRAEWIVLESADAWIPRAVGGYGDRPRLEAFQLRIERSRQWAKVFEQDGVFVFRKAWP
jgi:uncharacterized membrane protein